MSDAKATIEMLLEHVGEAHDRLDTLTTILVGSANVIQSGAAEHAEKIRMVSALLEIRRLANREEQLWARSDDEATNADPIAEYRIAWALLGAVADRSFTSFTMGDRDYGIPATAADVVELRPAVEKLLRGHLNAAELVRLQSQLEGLLRDDVDE